MARSFKHSPFDTNLVTRTGEDAEHRRAGARRERRVSNAALRAYLMADVEDMALPVRREVDNEYDRPGDGRRYNPESAKALRK